MFFSEFSHLFSDECHERIVNDPEFLSSQIDEMRKAFEKYADSETSLENALVLLSFVYAGKKILAPNEIQQISETLLDIYISFKAKCN